MSNNRENIVEFLNQGLEERERTAIELSEKHAEIAKLRKQLAAAEEEYDAAIDAAITAGWLHADLMKLGIADDPRSIAARKRARKRAAEEGQSLEEK